MDDSPQGSGADAQPPQQQPQAPQNAAPSPAPQSAPPAPSTPPKTTMAALAQGYHLHPHKKPLTLVGAALFVVVLIFLVQAMFGSIGFFAPKTNYMPVYVLVNDKISEHGGIIVNLPKGVSKSGAHERVSFEPAIPGEWVDTSIKDAILYKPQGALALGKHYLVSLRTDEGTIKKDFLVDEDPQVSSIFPASDGEANRHSAITIVFNRPMVPLTTLTELEDLEIPVTITPRTDGKFKWISTRTLQFIPKTALAGSAHYTVAVSDKMVSMDGLSVPEKTHSFTTTQLRLDGASNGTIVYNVPIEFSFNQPVDLDRTAQEISLKDESTGRTMEFLASYGQRQAWDDRAQKYVMQEDRSKISVLPKNSIRGHANVWEFSTSYTASIDTVYPVGGDILLKGSVFSAAAQASVTTTPLLQEVSARSEKTDLASADLFDPSGSVTFTFYEDIDIGRSNIQGKGVKKIVYGEKCDGVEGDYSYTSECKKVEDHSRLVFTFDADAYSRGERVDITFEKLVNDDGFQVNAQPFSSTLTVYPQLQILQSKPADKSSSASIQELVLCTNVPLKIQESAEFYKNFKANRYIVFGRWNQPYLMQSVTWLDAPCAAGQFVNQIRYGLLPQQSYSLDMTVEDVFGQKTAATLSLKTEAAPKFYLRFQNLQKIYNMTTPDKTKLTFATENFDHVDVHICKLSPDSMVKILATQPRETSTRGPETLPCEDSRSTRVQLRPDQWINQYFQIDIKDHFPDARGQYILSFSHPQFRDEKDSALFGRAYLSVTNIGVVTNRVRWTSYDFEPEVPDIVPPTRGSIYWLSRIHTLSPESAAKITVYNFTKAYDPDAPLELAASNTTNAAGFAEFPLIADVAGAAIESGQESAVLTPWADTLSQSWANAYQASKVYMYTDRPIYRPGQEVFIKGLYRVDFDGAFQIFRDNDVEITVNNSKGESVLKQRVPVSEYGTFAASVKLPADAPLGTYYISARNQAAFFDVQEYVGAAFETSATSDKDEYIAGETAKLGVVAKYYFGVPLDGGTLDYQITSQNFYFDRYADEYFNFGNYWYDCYGCGYGDTYLKSGKATLDEEGMTDLDLSLDFASLYKGADADQSKIIVFHGTIKDKQGKSVSFQKSFIVHRGDYYLGVKTSPTFAQVKQLFDMRVKTVDIHGKPLSKGDITVTVNRVSWDSNKRQEVDGGFYNRPQRVLTPVLTKNVSTNFSGDYSEQIQLTDPGEYEIQAVGTSGGNTIKSASTIYIFGPGSVDVQPTNNATLNLTAEKKDLKVGDTAKFIIQNPYPHAKALISIVRGHIFSYEVVDIRQSVYEYSFPIKEEHTPNVFASVVLLSPDPAVKFGQVEFTVDRKEKALNIEIQPDKRSYLPGEKVRLAITTTDASGKPVAADVSLAVADVSVLALKGNPRKDPLVFFYDGLPLSVSAETNIKNLLEETPVPTGTKGGDGGSAEDLATRKRGEFKDTAFWQASVITNAAGRAEVSFDLPDNLTKWQVEGVGITKDTRLGVKYEEILGKKELMAVPMSPRFVVPGDEFMIGAKIFNETPQQQTLNVSLESPTLDIQGAGQSQKTVGAGETATVYFSVAAPKGMYEGAHAFTISAKNASYNDTVELKIPITRNMTYEHTATAGSSESDVTEYLYLPDSVVKDRGGLTIKTSATLAVFVSDALKYLFQYPYGCSEQLASKLSAIAVGKRALSVPNVDYEMPTVTYGDQEYTADQAVQIGLDRIYENQSLDGGFAYYKGLESDQYLTMHVVATLSDIKKAGYEVRPGVLSRAISYLHGQIGYFKTRLDTDSVIRLAYALGRAGDASGEREALVSYIQGVATAKYLNDRATSDTLATLALLTAQGGTTPAFKNTVYATLLNRVDIDSRGAYLRVNRSNFGWSYWETPQKDTALLIKALAADKREHDETENLIRWLVASRASDGSWGSTNTSLAAIDALTEYLLWKRETESSFALSTLLDQEEIVKTEYTQKNIFSSTETFLPVAKIDLGKTHALRFTKANNNQRPNRFYYDLRLTYFLPTEQIGPRDEGIAIERQFFAVNDTKNERPLSEAKVGEVVRGVIRIISPKDRHLFSVEDYIPAGFELVNFSLATEDEATIQGGGLGENSTPPQHKVSKRSFVERLLASAGFGSDTATSVASDEGALSYEKFYPQFQELHDDRLFLFAEDLRPGAYEYEYYVRATTPGSFSHLPAVASDMYFPENFGRMAGAVFTVGQ